MILKLSPRRPTVLIVDDHPVCGAMLKSILYSIDPDCRIDFADTSSTMFDCLKKQPYSHVFVDLQLPDVRGLEGLSLARAVQPYARMAIFSGALSPALADQAIALGACAVIPKTLPLKELEQAVRSFLTGVSDPADASKLPNSRADATSPPPADLLGTLSPSELRVMTAVARGLQNKQIAFELQLTEATIKSHLQSVFRKLRVSNRTQAVLAYREVLGGA